jgi:hypothetical protein
VLKNFEGIWERLDLEQARGIAREVLRPFIAGEIDALYLIYNEGYSRADDHLVDEALRLTRLLVDLMPGEDEARGLLALVAFQMARRPTRFDAGGDLVPMDEQDRGRWLPSLVEEGQRQLRQAASTGRPPGPRPRKNSAPRRRVWRSWPRTAPTRSAPRAMPSFRKSRRSPRSYARRPSRS